MSDDHTHRPSVPVDWKEHGVRVIPGNYQPMQGVCPWWDAARRAGA